MDKPLLSICIPTYNRCEYLERCLSAIVNQKGFDNRVEVVISDNCSTDNTQIIGKKYDEEYSNVHYHRMDENVCASVNQLFVLKNASGILRKLTNDTIIYYDGAIEYMLRAANNSIEKKPKLFFLNSEKLVRDSIHVKTMENYIDTLGYWITWIASFTVWEGDCDDLDIFVEKKDTSLAQVPFLLKNFEKHGEAIIYDKLIMYSIVPKSKNLTYGLYHVFYETFLSFLQPYIESGKISKQCYEGLRKNLLLNFFTEWIVRKEMASNYYRFSDEDLRGLIESAYRNETYYIDYKIKLYRLRLKSIIQKMLKAGTGTNNAI